MRPTPVVILGYNRPEKMERLLERLNVLKPPVIHYVIDGPKAYVVGDEERVDAVRSLASRISWTDDVEIRFRPTNIGLRASVTEAVSHAVNLYGQVIVLEEDTMPGEQWIPYALEMLEYFRSDPRVMHISGYNVVPESALSTPKGRSRLTRYPESIAWATWDRAWQYYDSDLTWARSVSLSHLSKILGSHRGALRWKQNFSDAHADRISTWAYRWIATIWSRNGYALSPNKNLVTYIGFDEGTHTVTEAPWDELDLYTGTLAELIERNPHIDPGAESWVRQRVFRENMRGLVRGSAISFVLSIRKWQRNRRKRRG